MIHDSLRITKLESPDKDFTSRVMKNLNVAQSRLILSPKKGLMLLLGIGVALILGVIYLSSGAFDEAVGTVSFDQLNLPKTVILQELPKIPLRGNLIMKILVGLNLAIAFVLIDRTILQPYFRNRSTRKA